MFVQVLEIRVASGVDIKFPYGVLIADRGLSAATLFPPPFPIMSSNDADV